VVFGGDFRQILPVIPKGTRSEIVNSWINASYIWDHCKVLTLTKNTRLRQGATDPESKENDVFSKLLLMLEKENSQNQMMEQLKLRFLRKSWLHNLKILLKELWIVLIQAFWTITRTLNIYWIEQF
jgi:hypothetical protein